MPSPFLRVAAPLALLAIAGCDSVDCEDVEPCRDAVAVRIAGAGSYVDGVFNRPVSPEPGAYAIVTVAGVVQDTCTFAVSGEIAPTVEGVVDAGTCGERLRVDTFGSAFAVWVEYPVFDAESVTVSVARDGATVGTTTAAVVYAQPSQADTACRADTCRQARIEVPID